MTDLLVGGLRHTSEPSDLNRLRELSPADFDALVEASVWHGVAPLLFVRLKNKAPDLLDRDGGAVLRDLHAHCTVRNAAIREQLADIAEVAESEGTRVLLLKGVHLAFFVYEEPGARAMGDIDLLVPAGDIETIHARLRRSGYDEVVTETPPDDYHLTDLVPEVGVEVELHRGLEPDHAPFSSDMQGLWRRSVAIQGAPNLVRAAADDALIHICTHMAFNHEFAVGLRGCCDIDALVRHSGDQLDWTRMVETANGDGRARFVYTALRLTQELLGTSLPADILSAFEHSPADEVMVDDATRFVGSMAETYPVTLDKVGRTASIWGKVWAGFRGVFPQPERMRRIYNRPSGVLLLVALYGWRPIDLLFRRGPQLARMAGGGEREVRDKAEWRRRIEEWTRVSESDGSS